MIVFTNDKLEIKDVGTTDDASLTENYIDDECNPFKGWSTAKICCYKATILFGRVVMMTPYVDSKLLEHIDQLGQQTAENNAAALDLANIIDENSTSIEDVAGIADENATSIEDLAEYAASLEERIAALEEIIGGNE